MFYFPSTSRVTAFNMLRLDAKLGEILGFSLSFLLRVLSGNRKPRHVEKFWECWLTDVGEGQLRDEKKNAQNMRSRSQNGRSNKSVSPTYCRTVMYAGRVARAP